MLSRPFVSPIRWQPLRQWLPATSALVAAVLLASAIGRHSGTAALAPVVPSPTERPMTTTPAFATAPAPITAFEPLPATAAGRATDVARSTVLALPSVVIHAVRVGTPTTADALNTPRVADMPVPPTTVGRPITAAAPTNTTVAADSTTSLAWVAAAWLLALAVLMAGAVAYLVRALPRLPAQRAAATTGAVCAALAVAGLALAAWADAGMAGALLSALLVALPALAVLSGHGGYALGRRAQRVSRRTSAGGMARRASDAANAGAATTATMLSGAALPDTAAEPSTDRALLGNFRIEGELGRGAMGVVYLGRHQGTGQRVALKTLAIAAHRDAADGAEAQRRFLREAAMATRLRHPDIVAVVGSGEQNGLAYIAMEYVDGHDLCRHTRADSLLPLPVLLDAIARVADALAYAHAQAIVHRDIKPANLMWNPATRQVKVTDFGVARVADGGRTNTGVLMGTPSHLAPEQLAGRVLDGRADLYALGVTLYQLITGQLPQRAESMARLMFEIANVQAPDVRRLRPDTPPALAAIVARLLEKRPDDRYADGRALAADLRSVLVATAPPDAAPAAQASASAPVATGHNSVF